jgi:hypothetical protein
MPDHAGFIEPVGDVELWWIVRPAPPRLSLRTFGVATAVIALPLLGLLVGSGRFGGEPWPWPTVGPLDPTAAQVATRYQLLALAGLAYLGLRSVGPWIRIGRTLRSDLSAARSRVAAGDWTEAALHLHRHAVLAREFWGRDPRGPESTRLDADIRQHLGTSRRVYLHVHRRRPALPDNVEAGFSPRVVPSSVAGGWWMVPVILVLAANVFADLTTALQSGQWHVLVRFSFVLSSAILAVYAAVHLLALMGWREYLRFAPGMVERVTYRVLRTGPKIEPIHLRTYDAFVDLTGWTIGLTLTDPRRNRTVFSCQLWNNAENLDSCLRSLLSVADVAPPPQDALTD